MLGSRPLLTLKGKTIRKEQQSEQYSIEKIMTPRIIQDQEQHITTTAKTTQPLPNPNINFTLYHPSQLPNPPISLPPVPTSPPRIHTPRRLHSVSPHRILKHPKSYS